MNERKEQPSSQFPPTILASPSPDGSSLLASGVPTVSQQPPPSSGNNLNWDFAPAQQSDELGRLGPYRILKRLGGGGMGEVFLAEDQALGRRVALKLMRRELAGDADARERFFREARAMAALDHQYVIPLFQIGEESGIPFLSMPYLVGETLAARLAREPKPPLDFVLKLGIQLAEGLSAAHQAGMVHRDVKPSNIWLVPATKNQEDETDFQQIRILDFGLVRVLDGENSLTGPNDLLGTVNYMSPEQAALKKVDFRSDLFSLGVVLYEASTGSHPFVRTNPMATLQALATARPRDPRFFDAHILPEFSKLVIKLLSKAPTDRPRSAHEVVRNLLRIRDLLGIRREIRQRKPPADFVDASDEDEEPSEFQLRDLFTRERVALVLLVLGITLNWIFTHFKPPMDHSSEKQPAHYTSTMSEGPPAGEHDERGPAEDATTSQTSTSGGEDKQSVKRIRGNDSGTAVNIADRSHIADEDDTQWITPTSDAIQDVAVADGGRLLVLKIRGEDGLTVYDVASGRLVKVLRLPTTEFVFAAGGRRALVYLKEFRQLQQWNLKTFRREAVQDLSSEGILMRIVMGHSRDDRALVRLAHGSSALDRAGLYWLDVGTLTVERDGDGPSMLRSHNSSFRDFVHYRANGDLSIITEWASSHSPTGVGLLLRNEDNSYSHHYDHDSASFLSASDDGNIYTGNGKILSSTVAEPRPGAYGNQIPQIGQVPESVLVPAIGGSLVVGLQRDGQMHLYQSGRTVPLCPLGRFPEWGEDEKTSGSSPPNRLMAEQWTKSTFTLDKRIVPLPQQGYLILLPDTNDRIIRRPLKLRELLKSTGKPFLLVLSSPPRTVGWGESWRYQIQTTSDQEAFRYELVKGPDGMKINSDGELSWQAPAGVEGHTQVWVRIINGGGRELVHRFQVEIGPSAETGAESEQPQD